MPQSRGGRYVVLLRQDRDAFMGADSAVGYYGAHDSVAARLAGLYLLPFAAILFLWFIVALRGWVRSTQRRRNMLVSDLQLVSGVVFTAIFLIGAAAVATSVIVLGSDADSVSASSLQTLSNFGATLMGVMGVRMAAIFVMATASLGMTTGALPRLFSLIELRLRPDPDAHAHGRRRPHHRFPDVGHRAQRDAAVPPRQGAHR